MDHSEMYARLGQVVSQVLYRHLSSVHALPAPGNQIFQLEMLQEPDIYHGGWTFTFDVALPKEEGTLLFAVSQVGSGFDPDKITLPLPPKDFNDDSLEKFPPAHQEMFYELVDIVRNEIEKRGFKNDSSGDFLINEDYYPSSGVSLSVMNPQVIAKDLAQFLQTQLQGRPFSFYISFALIFDDPTYKGKEERLTIRDDRIVEDWNIDRLRREFGSRLAW